MTGGPIEVRLEVDGVPAVRRFGPHAAPHVVAYYRRVAAAQAETRAASRALAARVPTPPRKRPTRPRD